MSPGDLLSARTRAYIVSQLKFVGEGGYAWPSYDVTWFVEDGEPLLLLAVAPDRVGFPNGHSTDTLYYFLHPFAVGWHVVEDDQWEDIFTWELEP